ncbi:M23 family metallopeptidase [Actinokineospora soli]|uniref:M23 family metallopeptidase n=1 Tax=Actinokineospora soli TaxID=1048753 RepID=A0ABW2TWZ9_9PSEU
MFTSGFGARWGTTHYGIDIANHVGTPIVSAADGYVIEAGTASGFGLWLRIQHDDGTIGVYGHIDDYVVREGERVKAGELIAHMGNRGQSTGPHLHFEIWDSEGHKMNPTSWLNRHGIGF